MRRLFPLLLPAAALVVACSSSDPPSELVGQSSSAIINGQLDTTHQAVVMLYSQSGDKAGLCSGTIVKIDPTTHIGWVATAAHCVEAQPSIVIQGNDFLGSDVLRYEVVDFAASDTNMAIKIKDGRRAAGDILIGADGINSIVRKRLHPNEPPPRRSGYYAVRGVAYHVDQHLGSLSAAAYFGRGIEAAMVRAGQTAVYWYVSLPAEDVRRETHDPRAVVERAAAALDDRFRAVAPRHRA